jgi:hypothetical protein
LILLAWSWTTRSWPVETYFPTLRYRPVEATIDDGRVIELSPSERDGRRRFAPQLRLRFEVDAEELSVWLPISSPHTSSDAARQRLDEIPLGQKRTIWFDPEHPSRSTFYRPQTWGLWLAATLLVGLVGWGIYGVIAVALMSRTSAERRQALAKAARAKMQLGEAALPPPREYPTVPLENNLINSPGIKLKYRLPAVQEPAWRLFGAAVWMLTCLALASSLVVVAVEQHISGDPRWFLTGFALLVTALASWSTYYFLRELVSTGWIGPTTMEISAAPLFPGREYQVYFNQPGTLTVERLRILLACDEETTYLQGTDIRRDVQRVFQSELCSRVGVEIDATRPLEASLIVKIPAQAMHSYKSRFNAVNWKLVVEIDAEGWPLYQRSFPLVVYPNGNSGGTH